MDKAQTQLDEPRHAALLQESLEDQSTQDNQALSTGKADNSECASSLQAETADLAQVEKSLPAMVIAQSWQSSDDDDGELSAPLEDLAAMVDAAAVSCV